jgi:drug/metabolite transporter (DMT)-like permease
MHQSPVVWCLLAAALFGESTPASKFLLGDIGPMTLAGLLYLGAGLFAIPFSRRGGSPQARRSHKNLLCLAGAVLAGGVAGPLLMLSGLSLSPAASASLWLNLETPATAVLSVMFFREHLDRRGWIAAIIVTVASVVLAAPQSFALAPAALLLLAGCTCWALDNNLTALIDGWTPAQSALLKGLVAGSINLMLAALVGEPFPPLAHALRTLGVGTLGYGASLVLYVAAAQHLGATRSQMAFATAPLFGVLLAWTLLAEAVLAIQVVCGAMMAFGVWLSVGDAHVHRHRHEAIAHTHWHRHDDGHHNHSHDGMPLFGWHIHEHTHEAMEHEHLHRPDLHHRHQHR